MSDYTKLSEAIEKQNRSIQDLRTQNDIHSEKLDVTIRSLSRLVMWAEGDRDLGNPSVQHKIDSNKKEIADTRKLVYGNDDEIKKIKMIVAQNTDQIKDTKAHSTILGAGSGGILVAIIEMIKQLF